MSIDTEHSKEETQRLVKQMPQVASVTTGRRVAVGRVFVEDASASRAEDSRTMDMSSHTAPHNYRRSFSGLLLSVRYEIVGVIARFPAVYFPLMRLYLWATGRGRRVAKIARRDTELVIEGYPRSANTFAVEALQLAQGRAVKVAHHLHAAAHVIGAVRRHVPVLVLVRDPEQAVPSTVVRAPHLSPAQALREYTRFYRWIEPYRDRFVVATFEEVTGDFGPVTRRVNDWFGTSFHPFEHSEENVRKCFEMIDEVNRADTNERQIQEHTVSRPTGSREQVKKRVRERLHDPALTEALQAAHRIYEDFCSYASRRP